MKQKIFVYGTLRKGGAANHLMEESSWLGSANLSGQLFKIDWYPGAIYKPGSNQFVVGDIYEVSAKTLSQLDHYEGCSHAHSQPHEYRRIEVTVTTQHGSETCQFWEYAWALSQRKRIITGDWLKPL